MRIPVAVALMNALTPTGTDCMRPSGSPRKIVDPAIAPSNRIWAVLM